MERLLNSISPVINAMIFAQDDDEDVLEQMQEKFDEVKANYKLFETPQLLVKEFTKDVQLCILDHYTYGVETGFTTMREVLHINPTCSVIILSGQHSIKVVRKYMNNGAFRYVDKNEPDFIEELMDYIGQAIELTNKRFSIFREMQENFNSTQLLFKSFRNVSSDNGSKRTHSFSG